MKQIYLDSAATTQLHPEVIKEMTEVMTDIYGNPSSLHSFGRKAKGILEASRKKISTLLGVKPNEIIFTSCGSEANNMAISCAINDLNVKRIISSRIEHKAVLDVCKGFQIKGVNIEYVDIDEEGNIDLEHLQKLLDASSDTTLVSLMHANNEIGTLLPIDKVAKLCNRNNVYFHSDMVQTIGHYPINLSNFHIHFTSSSAHKYHGPKGVGFLYLKHGVKLSPLIIGGGQERNLRAGTENIVAISGMAKALEIALNNHDIDKNKVLKLRNKLKEGLLEISKEITFNGNYNDSLYTILSCNIPMEESERSVFLFRLSL